ncbi:putative fluoride ion transporter CrcB [Spirochaetia bacterium]|nr:putative fluoride ion transporter CrcB [Spirochaetia bacterium]
MNYLFVILGGGIGAVLRYLSTQGITALAKVPFPAGTLAVNVVGALIIGFLFSLFEARAVPVGLRLFLITGFLGGYTTFSSYSLETARLMLEGNIPMALLNLLLNNGVCLLFVVLGISAGKLAG